MTIRTVAERLVAKGYATTSRPADQKSRGRKSGVQFMAKGDYRSALVKQTDRFVRQYALNGSADVAIIESALKNSS
jgi:hypothetical protein